MDTKFIFLRNDDLRDRLDSELITLTDLCINHKAPICHAVEPANVSADVVTWLKKTKEKHPDLIEIIQHGYDHNLSNPTAKMEFGGSRTFEDQLISIQKGQKLMDKHFGNSWSKVFTFPYGSYNLESLKAVDMAGYYAISSKVDFSLKNKVKNATGKLLGKDFLFNKKISYHDSSRKSFRFKELSVSANLIKNYIDSNRANHYSKHEIEQQISTASKHTDKVGILFHHRFHSTQFEVIDSLLNELKDDFQFSTITNLIR